jgi:hypothetical protein
MMRAVLISELVFSSVVVIFVAAAAAIIIIILWVVSVGVVLVFLLNSHTEITPLLLLMGFEIYFVMYMI